MVTNERVAQQGPGLPPLSEPDDKPLFTRTLSANIASTKQFEVWGTVDVPQGWYVAIAFDTDHSLDLFSRSRPFFVKTGANTSCLPLGLAPDIQPTSVPNQTSTAFPESSGAHTGTLQLIGAIVGVVVGVSLIAIAFSVPRIWKKFLPHTPLKRPGGPLLLY